MQQFGYLDFGEDERQEFESEVAPGAQPHGKQWCTAPLGSSVTAVSTFEDTGEEAARGNICPCDAAMLPGGLRVSEVHGGYASETGWKESPFRSGDVVSLDCITLWVQNNRKGRLVLSNSSKLKGGFSSRRLLAVVERSYDPGCLCPHWALSCRGWTVLSPCAQTHACAWAATALCAKLRYIWASGCRSVSFPPLTLTQMSLTSQVLMFLSFHLKRISWEGFFKG